MAVRNAQSMMNKTTIICDFIQSEHMDVFALTEAWFKGDARDDHSFADILSTFPGYKIHSLPVPVTLAREEGVVICVILCEGYVTEEKKHSFQSFECLELSAVSPKKESLKLLSSIDPIAVKSLLLYSFKISTPS